MFLQLAVQRVREYAHFDSKLLGAAMAWGATGLAFLSWAFGDRRRGLQLLSAAHRSQHSKTVQRLAEYLLRPPAKPEKRWRDVQVERAYADYLTSVSTGAAHLRPRNLIGSRLLVVKSPDSNERGVLIIDYTYVFPLFARFCDLDALSRRYYIVLEPSWVGYCTPEILMYSRLGQPVFVQTTEPRDAATLARLSPHFHPVGTQANWWVDNRIMKPVQGITKDIDVCLVAGWAKFKRHAPAFAALRQLQDAGRPLKTLLIGYAIDGTLSKADVLRQAEYFGVSKLLEIHEDLEPEEVARQLSRSKVHVLWSRREGSNKAIIEAMLVDVPGILREGFNYGHKYPYVNPQTGRYADEQSLPEAILSVIDHPQQFEPRAWVMEHMTPQHATAVLNATIRQVALARGEQWRTDLAVKTKQLKRMTYWNPADTEKFAGDHAAIMSLMRD